MCIRDSFYRENTEGEYVLGSRGVEIPGKLSMDFKVTTEAGTRRIAKAAFDYAAANGKDNVAIVTKANIMKKTDGNFTRICHEVAADYPGIKADDWYIDIMTANLVNKDIRSSFQVFVLPNLYGDIITDEAAEIQGGVGTAEMCIRDRVKPVVPSVVRKRLENAIRLQKALKQASHDLMTNLLNRSAFMDKVESMLYKAERDVKCAFFVIDPVSYTHLFTITDHIVTC